MPRRLIVHAGFHKTGTTTIQKTLAAHVELLRPHAEIVLRRDMVGLCEAARAYSISRSEFDLGLVKYETAALAEAWSQGTIILSSEDLSGHMPGRRGLMDYNAAPNLARAMTDTWRAAFAGVEVYWIYTTRAATPWLISCHAQHLRAIRITLDASTYAEQYASSADLSGIVAQVRDHLGGTSVTTLPLETHSRDLTAPILHAAQIPKEVCDQVTPVRPANTAPSSDHIAERLALNRSTLSDKDWRAARKALNKRQT